MFPPQVSVFAFTFTQPGTYVFASSTNGDAQTVVVVQASGRSCGVVDGPLSPMSGSALTALGVVKARPTVLEPNWALLGALVGGLLLVAVGVVGCLVVFRARGLASTSRGTALVKQARARGARGWGGGAATRRKGTTRSRTTRAPRRCLGPG